MKVIKSPAKSINQTLGRPAAVLGSVLPVLAGAALLSCVGVGYAQFRFGSIESARSFAGGDRILVDHPVQTVALEPGTREIRLEYRLTNLENEPVALIGSNNSCSCTMVDELPKQINAGGTVVIAARIQIDEKTAAEGSRGAIRIYTGHVRNAEISLDYILSGIGDQGGGLKKHESARH